MKFAFGEFPPLVPGGSVHGGLREGKAQGTLGGCSPLRGGWGPTVHSPPLRVWQRLGQ